MNTVIRIIAPWLVKAISSEVVRRAAQAIVRAAFDRAEAELIARGQRPAAEVLQAIEAQLVDDPTPLIEAAQRAVLDTPPVAARR